MIDAQFVKRERIVSAERLRNNAKKLDAWFVDYRTMGYVTEVKDQVRHSWFKHSFLLSTLNVEHLQMNVAYRVTVAPAGPSVQQELLRDKYTRAQVSLYPWVNKIWWTAPELMAPLAAMVPGWPMPTTMLSATGCSRHTTTRTPQWWGSTGWLPLHQSSLNSTLLWTPPAVNCNIFLNRIPSPVTTTTHLQSLM